MNNFILSGQALAEGIALSWPSVANAVRYEIRRREALDQNTVVGVAEKAVFLDEKTYEEVEYVYRIRAILDNGDSVDSLMLDITACGPLVTSIKTYGKPGIHRE